jgi:membrane protease YdiL (CAAX protease family)
MSSTATSVVIRGDRTRSVVNPLRLIERFPVAALVILTFVLTWLFEIPMVLDARGELPFAFPFWCVILMGWMPGFAAIIVAGTTGGRAAVRKLFARVLIWRIGWPWYVLVSGGTAAVWLSAVLLNPLFGGSGLQATEFTPELLVGLTIQFILLFLVNSEELVWRGSIFPRLQLRWSALQASVVIGVFEGLFHLPLFFKPDSDQAATGLPVFVLGSVAGAIIFSWVFNNTSGSLLLIQLFHIFANTWITSFSTVPADNVISQWIFNGLLLVIALIVLVTCGAQSLSRSSASALPVIAATE